MTSAAIVDRGRNIVSTSRDGTAKLWDVGQQTSITTFDELGGSANYCYLGIPNASFDLGQPDIPPSKYYFVSVFISYVMNIICYRIQILYDEHHMTLNTHMLLMYLP